ncbi:hypothetical protein DCE79_11110 [Lysinibacillus sp. 2017]|uniref:hypothetical protein n=1 Tax=unclassified Lysinibacillus TaxID=2636778 RepID=UPI000D5280A7|nr:MULTISPECIES: hypothetical protein [unclassified Lysinibacillus]AWE07901.1 hypothetical protein DCE79_11110 [Lysinibacillus sp. 2017]TGN33151.1 hypothetical protein E4L99_15025 [Lysinibacillus sp. S2017]
MKQLVSKATEKQYVKAWLKLLTEVAQVPRRIIKEGDGYFFDEGSADIRPYFYGSISFGLVVLLFCYLTVSG